MKFHVKLKRNDDGSWLAPEVPDDDTCFPCDGLIYSACCEEDGIFLRKDCDLAWPIKLRFEFTVLSAGGLRDPTVQPPSTNGTVSSLVVGIFFNEAFEDSHLESELLISFSVYREMAC